MIDASQTVDGGPRARARRPVALRCYYSLRSPYSWLALRRLEAARLGLGSRLAYLPFFEPAGELRARLEAQGARCLYTPMSKARHLYILGDVKRLLAALGEAPCWPVDVDVDWSIAHRVAQACPDDATRRDYVFDAMDARWRRGEDIFDADHARALLAARHGERAARAILDDAFSEAVDTALVDALAAAWRDDVFGVPLLVCGRERFWGHDRVDPFLAALASHDRAAAAAAPQPTHGAPA